MFRPPNYYNAPLFVTLISQTHMHARALTEYTITLPPLEVLLTGMHIAVVLFLLFGYLHPIETQVTFEEKGKSKGEGNK
jgi:hypothetical protein